MTNRTTELKLAENSVPQEHRYYFNGFLATIGPADISITLLQNNEPTAMMMGSHTAVKSVANGLLEIIELFEKATETTVKTVDELGKAMSKPQS